MRTTQVEDKAQALFKQKQEISLENSYILILIIVTPVEIGARLAQFPISVTK